MRTDCKTIYRYSELSEDAQEQALEDVSQRLYEWVESDQLADVMVEALGYELGQHEEGEGQPLRGVDIAEWSIDRNGRDSLSLDGTLTTETAPKLPWPTDVGYIRLGRTNSEWTGSDRDAWLIDEDGQALYPEWMADQDRPDVAALFNALDDVVTTALAAGCSEYDHLTSLEGARDYLEANDPETFDAEGAWI